MSVPASTRPRGGILLEDEVRIPADVFDLASFREWARSDDFPDRGRIDFLGGEIEVTMSPENLGSHGSPKTAMVAALHAEIDARDLGQVWTDRARLSNEAAGLSVEPDIVVWSALESGRATLIAKAGTAPGEGEYVEIEGSADIVVEIVSDSSVGKDTVRLRERYHTAGVAEYWLVDARGTQLAFTLLEHTPEGYVAVAPTRSGFAHSTVLDRNVRLARRPARLGLFRYTLEIRHSRRTGPARKRSRRKP